MERAIYSSLILSYLHGMAHILEKFEAKEILNFSDYLIPEEAIEFLRQRVSLSKEEFYRLEAKARFRAFTVALLTGLDAIEKVKEKLLKALEEGKSLREFIEELGHEEVIKKAGFSKTNPWYWETVFRTNLHSAYNAGRIAQIKRLGEKVKYLRYVAIDDNRTTEICKRLNGTTLPADDPFWETRIPPNHFRCRSTVVPIFKGEEVKPTPKPKVKPSDGFDTSPLSSWWKPSESMARRIVEYGYGELVEEKAKKLLCGKNFSDECKEFEEVKKLLDTYKAIADKQKKAEESFLNKLSQSIDKGAEYTLRKLFVNEREFLKHLKKHGKNDADFYLKKILEVLSEYNGVIYEEFASGWDRIMYIFYKGSWIVVITQNGNLLTAYPKLKPLKEIIQNRKFEGVKHYTGVKNEDFRKRVREILRSIRDRS